MPALNFKAQFVEPIRAGIKNHTIRADRKIPIKRGDLLYLYCGMRHKGAFRILPEAVTCTKIETIEIVPMVCILSVSPVRINGQILSDDECQRLSIADGFSSFADMMNFWEGRLPFKGQIIHWKENDGSARS